MRNIFIILLFAVAAAGCENTAEKSRRFSAYYDIDSLINSQLKYFSGKDIRVKKGAELNSRSDTSAYAADSLQLAQELNAFRKANINKPANEGLYTKKVSSRDSLRKVEYLPVNEKKDLEVQYLHLYFNKDQLVKMEAHVVENHWLYDSDRILTLTIRSNKKPALIRSYQIKGSQKMIFRDRVNFVIKGSIIPESISLR